VSTTKKQTTWWMIGGGLGIVVLVAGALLGSGLVPSGAKSAARAAAPAPSDESQSAEPAPPREAGAPAEAVAVTVAAAKLAAVRRAVSVVGTFSGYDEVTVMAEVSGRVARVNHELGEVGTVVRPGDVLLELDPTDYELAVEETRRALELEAARIGLPVPPENYKPEDILAKLRGGFDIGKLPTVLRAKEQEENARSRLERARQLVERGTLTQEEFDQRSTDYQVAVTMRLQAEMDATAVVAGIKHRLVLLKLAERKLKLTQVVVPTPTRREGMPADPKYVVAQRKVTEGEMVKDSPGSSTAAFELVMDEVLKLMVSVPERYVGEVKTGQKAEIRVEAYPERVFEGSVAYIGPMVDRTSRTFEVEIRVENAKRELKAGGFAKADILTRIDPKALTVPSEAVVSFAGSTKVFVVRNEAVTAVPVMLGATGPGWVEVVGVDPARLAPGMLVVTSGQGRLADGSRIRVRQGETAAAQAPVASSPKAVP